MKLTEIQGTFSKENDYDIDLETAFTPKLAVHKS